MDSLKALRKAVIEIEEELYVPWPEMGTKEWFQRYVAEIKDYATRPNQMTVEKAAETFKNLAKFDPKFASLSKTAHDSALELMNYTLTKTENK